MDYRFHDPALLAEALTHSSVAEHRLASNERMEFLGDSVFGCVVCEYLFRYYPKMEEGQMTKIKSAVVSRRVCSEVANHLGLPELMSLGKGINGRGELPASLAAAVYESIVAAIYLDGGFEPARQFILRHLEPIIRSTAESAHQFDYKSSLQQYAQRLLVCLPVYHLLDTQGPDHSKCFEVAVELKGQRYPSAWGQSKKQAEQEAALRALKDLGIFHLDPQGQVSVEEKQS